MVLHLWVKNVLDLVKLKGLYPYKYMSDFEKCKE